MKTTRLHGMTELPPGKAIGEVLPEFSEVKHEIRLGQPNSVCPGCRKPFTAVRKPRKAIRIYPVHSAIPFAFSYNLCGACVARHRRGGVDRDAVLAAIEAYCEGYEADQ